MSVSRAQRTISEKALTRTMKDSQDVSAEKLRGGYYTDSDIAAFLLQWVLHSEPENLLEPSCGDGAFFQALSQLEHPTLESVVGFDIEPDEAATAERAAEKIEGVQADVKSKDFLGWFLTQANQPEQFDAVVGNPPFVRYQYLSDEMQNRSKKIFECFRLPFTHHTNAWVPFVIASIALLRPGGRLAMVVPAEILHVLHAESLRTFLAKVCNKLLLFDPQELWFEEVLQGAVLLLAEKKPEKSAASQGVGIVPTRTRDFLHKNPETYFRQADYANGETIEGKWMRALLSTEEREVLRKAQQQDQVYQFDDVADVAVGIVTGANKFFLVEDDTVEEFGLEPWAEPMFGRSRHVPGVVYDEKIHQRNKAMGRRANFIKFEEDEALEDLPEAVRRYIRSGEEDELHERYKCRIRDPWYSVPSVYSTRVGMLKRSHHFPRLIYNRCEAYTTDTAYRIVPTRFDAPELVHSFMNSLTALSAELEGRHYGGGVLELVPSEISELLLPISDASEEDVYRLDSQVQEEQPPEKLMENQDEIVLGDVGLDLEEQESIRKAWVRLRARRQREDH